MRAVTLQFHPFPFTPKQTLHYHRLSPTFSRFIFASSVNSSQSENVYISLKPKKNRVADWVTENDDVARSLPIYAGGFSLFAILVNRAISGIAPVADASSSQSRADLLALALAVTNILSGLVWLSIRPKTISKVDPEGVKFRYIAPHLPASVVSELQWFWQSLSVVTCCRSLIIVYEGVCIFQLGVAAKSSTNDQAEIVDGTKFVQGPLYGGVMRSRTQSYLANLSLYPGKSELPFLPSNTQDNYQCALASNPLNKSPNEIWFETVEGYNKGSVYGAENAHDLYFTPPSRRRNSQTNQVKPTRRGSSLNSKSNLRMKGGLIKKGMKLIEQETRS